jgi:hypothetical protein
MPRPSHPSLDHSTWQRIKVMKILCMENSEVQIILLEAIVNTLKQWFSSLRGGAPPYPTESILWYVRFTQSSEEEYNTKMRYHIQ